MKKTISFLMMLAMVSAVGARGEEAGKTEIKLTQGEPGPAPASLQNEAQAALDRGAQWLVAQQNPEGYWSNQEFPALTALPVWALAKSGLKYQEAIDKAVKYILTCVHEDGSIWREPSEKRKGGGLANYNTAICMVALHAVSHPGLVPVVQNARRFIAGTQHLGGDDYRGGMGYDPETGRPYADLSNSYISYEGMRLTENVEDLRKKGDKKADLDWKAAQDFLARVQNKPGDTNNPDAGGFIYHPSQSMAGAVTNADGMVKFRSYGSMTYAGLLSLIYSDVTRDDPRVQSAFEWAARNWTLNENPGMGQEGLFYFFNVLSKSLAAYGQDQIHLKNGTQISWRNELIKKLVGLQKIDPKTGTGYWVNEQNRWWEADPVLVTSYSMLALEIAMGQ